MSALFVDGEVAELLRDSPDLLAVADAIAATQVRQQPDSRPSVARLGLLAATIAVAALVALAAPWQGRGSGFVAKALAALGKGQVVHVVSVTTVPDTEVLNVRSGASKPVETRTEIWFDGRRHLERVITSISGVQVSELLQTPAGAWTDGGPVYTCAWIAAHPLLAAKARVSCNAHGVNAKTPRHLPAPLPSLDPALTGFVSGYRNALASRQASRDGSGTLDGRTVEWLRFKLNNNQDSRIERVAVDAATLKPVLVEASVDGTRQIARIASIETVAPARVAFRRPSSDRESSRAPAGSSVASQHAATLGGAAAALGGHLVWAGRSIGTLTLAAITAQRILTGYGVSSRLPFKHSTGVQLVYGGTELPGQAAPYVRLSESRQPQLLYGFTATRQAPAEGEMRVDWIPVFAGGGSTSRSALTGRRIWHGLLRKDGLYVSLESTNRALLLRTARQLAGR